MKKVKNEVQHIERGILYSRIEHATYDQVGPNVWSKAQRDVRHAVAHSMLWDVKYPLFDYLSGNV